MATKVYSTHKRATMQKVLLSRMWPNRKFFVAPAGFHGFAVLLERPGQRPAYTGNLKPLPFTVTASGDLVVFRAVLVNSDQEHVYPTHRRALAKVKKHRGLHVEPVPFVGPVQPHTQRRIKYLVERALYF